MLISFTGKMGVGKTTSANYLLKKLEQKRIACKIIKFAGPLYDMQKSIYDIAKLPHPKEKDRKLLQYLGTEWGRQKDENLWTNIFKKRVKEAFEQDIIVLNDDLRFDNEAVTIDELGGHIILVEGHDHHNPETIISQDHKSEQGISRHLANFKIANSGTVEQLYECLDDLVRVSINFKK